MAVKYKLYGLNSSGDEKLLVTENHGKANATEQDFDDALESVSDMYGYEPSRVVLSSDTTVYVPEA